MALAGAAAFGVLALARGETISAAWLVVAAVCTYLVAYRFYSRFIAAKVFGLDARRATPAERLNNGRDFHPTSRWILFGHHFSAISGAGPLVGPTLAAQFGFLPGTLWLIAGVVLGGAVQDLLILCASMRRDGKSLGQIAKEEVNPVAGIAAMVAIFAIMIILLAVLGLVVVNALRDSPWGLFTISCTIPIALLMGWWMNNLRPGKVAEATVIGIALLAAALVGGQWVSQSATWAPAFTWSGTQAGVGGDDLRLRRRGAAGVAAAGAARLPVGLHEGRHDPRARPRHHHRHAAAQAAGADAVHRRHRAGVCRQAVSVCVHHHRLRCRVRLPRAGVERHDTQDAAV